jgi:outer membrane lipoprotein carrier protein
MTWLIRLAPSLIALFGYAAMAAEPVDEETGRQLVDSFVEDITTFSAGFEQVLLDPDGEVLERTTGTLEISRPGKFRWSYVEPYEQWLIADGLNIWSYDVDLAQVTVKPQAQALANTPALLLGGAEDALDQFDYEGSYRETVTTWVQLAPKNTESGFMRVELGFIDDVLTRMVFFDNLDQTTLVEFDGLVVNESIKSERFEFIVPDDVDVVGTPAVAGVLQD